MPKQRGNQSKEKTLVRLMKEVAVMQELQVGGGAGHLGEGLGGGGRWLGLGGRALRPGRRRLSAPRAPRRRRARPRLPTTPALSPPPAPPVRRGPARPPRPQDCPSLVRLLACYENDEEVQVVMEMCHGGDIQQLSEVRVGVLGRFLGGGGGVVEG
jgi:hypothetical protein